MPNSPQTAHRKFARQRGAALLIMLFLAAVAAMAVLVSRLNSVTQRAEQQSIAASTQLEGKNALLGYLRTNGAPEFWGLLPLPDMGKRDAGAHVEGESPANFGADAARNLLANGDNQLLVGRLPVKTLGTRALRDSSGNCLWYAVSAAFKASNASAPGYVPSFNWDTLGDFETGLSNNPHDSRAVALVIGPGTPQGGQSRAASGFDTIGECGGNYISTNYLENLSINPANPTTDANQAAYPLPAAVPSPANPPAPAITLTLPASTDAGTDHVQPISSGEIFSQLASSGKIQTAVNTLLPLLKNCLESQNIPVAGLNLITSTTPPQSRHIGPLPSALDCTATIPSASTNGKELARWRDNFWLLACDSPQTDCVSLTDSTTPGPAQSCDGMIVFSGARTTNQRRSNTGEKQSPAQYLETTLAAFNSAAEANAQGRPMLPANPDQLTEDVALCLKRPGTPTRVELDNFQDVTPNIGGRTLVQRDTTTDILILGDPTLTTASIPGSASGCTFSGDTYAFGTGARFYFRFRIDDRGDGFVFALIDAERNVNALGNPTAQVCGGAGGSGQYLGYASRDLDAGNNLLAPPIEYPKIGLEIDTARNSFGTANVGDTTNAHLALVYWGRSHDWPAPQPASPYEDDNTHGSPPQPQAGYQDPFADSAFGYPALRDLNPSLRDFHVRYEVVRTYDAGNNRARYQTRVWIRRWDQMIPGMDNVTQDFSGITATAPDHADDVYIYDLTAGTEAFRLFRLGFTMSNSRTQTITVQNIKASLR